jgi:outer membrane immunogenic protein
LSKIKNLVCGIRITSLVDFLNYLARSGFLIGGLPMKKIALTTFALLGLTDLSLAADLPMKARPMIEPVAYYNWSGFYFGVHAGWGWSDINATELAPGTASFPTGTVFTTNKLSGPLGGVQGGFNWQLGSNFVLGVEGEFSAMGLHGTAISVSTVNGFVSTVDARTKDLELVTGRIGYAANNWLIFAKGGGAWSSGSTSGTGVLANGTFFETTASSTHRDGWVVGGGVEWGFAPGWSAKVEYNHIDFGSTNITIVPSRGANSFVTSSDTIDLVKAGLNYRFNWGGPVVARY